jgi:hypothetical protein
MLPRPTYLQQKDKTQIQKMSQEAKRKPNVNIKHIVRTIRMKRNKRVKTIDLKKTS